jgi:hypothetical protein
LIIAAAGGCDFIKRKFLHRTRTIIRVNNLHKEEEEEEGLYLRE